MSRFSVTGQKGLSRGIGAESVSSHDMACVASDPQVPAGNTQVDRSTVTYQVLGEKDKKIFNIMFALGEPLLQPLLSLLQNHILVVF